MAEQECIETLLTALEAALDIAAFYERAVWGDGVLGRDLQQAQDDLAHLREFLQYESEKQGILEEKKG